MELALAHPEQGYYMNRDPFGAAGDFITAPEISQMFGELVGLWAAEVWRRWASPHPLRLVELGPGRGTLMSDALRAARLRAGVPAMRSTSRSSRASPKLAQIQYEALAGCGVGVAWHRTISETPPGPAIVIANEFFDALPVRQYVYSERALARARGRHRRGGRAQVRGLQRLTSPILAPGGEGDILEVGAGAPALDARARGAHGDSRAARCSSSTTATARPARRHAAGAARPPLVPPLADPGEADITAHVDFSALARSAQRSGRGGSWPDRSGRISHAGSAFSSAPHALSATLAGARRTNSRWRAAAASAERPQAKWARCSRRWRSRRRLPAPPGSAGVQEQGE